MSDTYTKLFSSITESTIWSESAGTRLVWITMLAKCNRYGEVFGAVPGLARLANVSLEECERAIETLLAPDKWSRTKEHEGRRIAVIDGGWRILNHAKFDSMRSDAEVAERRAEYKREWDRTNRPSGHQRTPWNSENSPTQSDTVRQQSDTNPTQSEPPPTATTTTTRAKKQKQPRAEAQGVLEIPLPACVDREAWRDYVEHRRAKRSALTDRAVHLTLANLDAMAARGLDPNDALRTSVANGWTGVFDPKPTARAGPGGTPPMSRTATAFHALGAIRDQAQSAATVVHREDQRRIAVADPDEPRWAAGK